jgi:GAF domain-containing protein
MARVQLAKTSPLSSIRTQILLGFGLIIGLTILIAVVNLVALRSVQARIQTAVDEVGRFRELVQQVENDFLLARQEEAAFMNNWRALGFDEARARHAAANARHLAGARQNLSELQRLIAAAPEGRYADVDALAVSLGPLLSEYEVAFQTTVAGIEQRSQAGGLDRALQETQAALEDEVQFIPNNDPILSLVLEAGAAEQAYFITRELEYVDRARLLISQLEALLNTTPTIDWAVTPLTRPRVLAAVGAHSAVFDQLRRLEGDIATNTLIFQEVTGEIRATTDAAGSTLTAALGEARAALRATTSRSTVVAVLASLIAVVAGALIAFVLARRILDPLDELTVAAQEVGRGNLDHTVRVIGHDEFAVLGRVFNQMATQLRGLVGSLEELVAERTRALTTTFEVSRRLSTILDRQQLVAEVVEQVRSTFDYYHAQIYLYDDRRETLRMVGGTGDAGRAMLAAGHKLLPDQGLVGKAAARGHLILVADVLDDPDWLPNPLLPATKSEVAVPIALGDRVLGVLDVQHDVRGALRAADAELLQSIANQVAIALQNARLYESARRTADREALVNAINLKIQRAVSVDGVLEVAAQELAQSLRARQVTVELGTESDAGDGRARQR